MRGRFESRRDAANGLFHAVLAAVLAAVPVCAVALSTDAEQDIIIEADRAELDDANGVVRYHGNVLMNQGSIRMTGATLTVYLTQDSDDIQRAIMLGEPATWRQLPDDSTVHDEAEALRMEYYADRKLLIMEQEVRLIQQDGVLQGQRMEYYTEENRAEVTGHTSAAGDSGRVRIRIREQAQ